MNRLRRDRSLTSDGGNQALSPTEVTIADTSYVGLITSVCLAYKPTTDDIREARHFTSMPCATW